MVNKRRFSKKDCISVISCAVLSIVLAIAVGITSYAATTTSKKSLYVGTKCSFVISGAKASNVKYTTSNKNIAPVSTKGIITAKKAGSATVTAVYKKNVFKLKVTVKKKPYYNVVKSMTLTEGGKGTIKLTTNMSGKKRYKSSRTSIAIVSSTGKIVAKKAGTCSIYAYLGSKKVGTCKLTVKKKAPAPVVPNGIATPKLSVYQVGSTYNLACKLAPSNCANKNISYRSSDTSIATIDASGRLTAKKEGIVTITATAAGNLRVTVSFKVRIFKYVCTNINVDVNSLKDLYVGGNSYTPTVTFKPSGIKLSECKIVSSNPAVAKIAGTQIVPVSAGTAKITITAPSGLAVAFNQLVESSSSISVSSISASIAKNPMYPGDTSVIETKVSPANATNKSLTFTSSNPSVAVVDAAGKVTAKSVGTARITISSTSAAKVAIEVKVVEKPTYTFTFTNVKQLYRVSDGAFQLTFTTNQGVTASEVQWSSSDTAVATVSNGVVTPKSDGVVTITVKTTKTEATVSFMVTTKTDAVDCDFEQESYNMNVGDVLNTKIIMDPVNASIKASSYTSSDTSVATVDANGKVTAKKAGYTIIEAKVVGYENGNEKTMTRQCVVYVAD